MAYNYIDEKQLGDALKESEDYMQPFYEPLAELERVTRGKPGKVAPGKPKVTDGTLAGMRREMPKQVIQQLPTGKAVVRDNDEATQYVNAILTDIILPNANSGGTPFAKSKNAIKDTFSIGSSWAYCFMNRRGGLVHADFRRVYAKDIYFEKGKVSEFDSNYMWMIGWYTEADLKSIIYWQKYLAKSAKERGETFEAEWDLKQLQKLLGNGPAEKDDQNKSEVEKQFSANNKGGYFKIAHCMQIGTGATFLSYAPTIKEVVKRCVTKDPRGIIPLHGLVPEEDYANPLGEPLAAISAGKQNLLDFDMQNYQYGQGMSYDPPVKKWGSTPDSKVRLAPGIIIGMNGTKQTDDFEVVNLNNAAINNFAQNYGLIKSQILNETGRTGDSSVSGEAGNPGFSKTQAGVKQLQQRLGTSNNDLGKSYELWFGRVCETMLNLHLAHSQGEKVLDLSDDTIKRLKLNEEPTFNYDQDFGKVRFTVDASTSQASDAEAESEKLIALQDAKSKYGQQPDEKFMRMYNQLVKNAGVDDPEDLMYSDAEIEQAKQMDEYVRQLNMQQLQAAGQPQTDQSNQPKPLGEAISWSPADLTPNERAQALAQVGIQADTSGAPTPNQLQQATDTAIKTDKHLHDTTQSTDNHVNGQLAPQLPQIETPSEQSGDVGPETGQADLATDRENARQQLLASGMDPHAVEQLLQQIDNQQRVQA